MFHSEGSVDWDFPTDALDVVTMGMYGHIGWLKWPNKSHREKAMEALDKVGMAAYAERQISELSGTAATCLFGKSTNTGGRFIFHG